MYDENKGIREWTLNAESAIEIQMDNEGNLRILDDV